MFLESGPEEHPQVNEDVIPYKDKEKLEKWMEEVEEILRGLVKKLLSQNSRQLFAIVLPWATRGWTFPKQIAPSGYTFASGALKSFVAACFHSL